MLKETVFTADNRRIIIMDSITKVAAEDKGSIVVAASHGGASSGEFALEVPLDLVILNDAGVGKDQAGIASLAMLDARDIACATVSHDSARIGDARDMWESGVISRANRVAAAMGVKQGQAIKDVLPRLLQRGGPE